MKIARKHCAKLCMDVENERSDQGSENRDQWRSTEKSNHRVTETQRKMSVRKRLYTTCCADTESAKEESFKKLFVRCPNGGI